MKITRPGASIRPTLNPSNSLLQPQTVRVHSELDPIVYLVVAESQLGVLKRHIVLRERNLGLPNAHLVDCEARSAVHHRLLRGASSVEKAPV